MNERDSAVTGIVEMSYNWLSYRVIHSGIASYAHFHDACLKYLKLFVQPYIIICQRLKKGVNEDVRIYFCPGSSEEMGNFGKTGTEAM